MGRTSFIRCKTGFSINPKDWSMVKGFPKQNDESAKEIFSHLKTLEKYLLDSVNDAQGKGTTISKDFLELKIDEHFNRKSPDDKTLVINHVHYIIDTAQKRKVKGKLGLSVNTIKNYNSFHKNFKDFQAYRKKTIHFWDIDYKLVDDYKNWLFDVRNYSVNYAGNNLARLKTVAKDALKSGILVNPYVLEIESFEESAEDRLIATLTFSELGKIRKATVERTALINARRWLLLGCEIGQRGNDLLSLKESKIRDIRKSNGEWIKVIDLKQGKGKKEVTLPLTPNALEAIKEGFPYEIADSKFNKYIKEIAKIAGLDEVIKGKKKDAVTNRVLRGYYPKHDLICSHTCRRSFATNYYKKISTPVLMQLTGHSKESTFLKYINRQVDKDDNAKLFLDQFESLGNNPKV